VSLRDLFREKTRGEAATAVILVRDAARVDPLSVVQAQRARGRKIVRQDGLVFAVDDRMALIKCMDAAYPEGELASLIQGSWWWPDAMDHVRAHRGRVLVHVPVSDVARDGDARERFVIATGLAADAIDESALGILWGATGVIVPPDRFVELAKDASRTQLPITLWVSVRFATVAGERVAFTTGMNGLGFPEIESDAGNGDPTPLATAIFEAAHDLVMGGMIDGLRDEPSRIHPRARVLRLA
jgi:hypothetical protein